MIDDAASPLESIRTNLYRTLRGTTAARGDPAMTCLVLEAGILEAIRGLDAILSPEPTARTRFAGRDDVRRGPGACVAARARKAAGSA